MSHVILSREAKPNCLHHSQHIGEVERDFLQRVSISKYANLPSVRVGEATGDIPLPTF